jgi:hypothetical protein
MVKDEPEVEMQITRTRVKADAVYVLDVGMLF